MRVVYAKEFLKTVASLPIEAQQKLDALIALLAEDAFHPSLHSKRLKGRLKRFYSFRITRDWRVIFSREETDTIQLIEVAHRKDIYR